MGALFKFNADGSGPDTAVSPPASMTVLDSVDWASALRHVVVNVRFTRFMPGPEIYSDSATIEGRPVLVVTDPLMQVVAGDAVLPGLRGGKATISFTLMRTTPQRASKWTGSITVTDPSVKALFTVTMGGAVASSRDTTVTGDNQFADGRTASFGETTAG